MLTKLRCPEPHKQCRTLDNERGMVLVYTLFIAILLLMLMGAGLMSSTQGLKSATNLKTGTATLHVADGCIQYALVPPYIPLGITFSYATETTILDSVAFSEGHTCTVKAVNDPASPGGDTKAILTSTAWGQNAAKKVVVAYIRRGNLGLGAISFPAVSASNTATNFSGDTFTVNGNDQCNAVPAVPGISVTDPALVTEITNTTTSDGGLQVNQMDNVMGQGASASVRTAAPWEKTVVQYADDYLALLPPGYEPLNERTYGGNDHWGTPGQSKITHVTGDVRIAGTIDGYGVLVLDGDLEVTGDFHFHGLVILRNGGTVRATGNATIEGAVLVGESPSGINLLDVRGNVNVRFNSCELQAADGWVPLPKEPTLIAWQEKLS